LDRETGYPLYEAPEADDCYGEEDNMCAACAAALRRRRVQAGTAPALRGFGAPAPRPAVASIGNGLYVRTRRAS
jgi:hypothetical protein